MKKTSFKTNEDTRIWCEYCRIFVYNNRINREKHDNSPQHQANFKKRVETIRREEEQQKKLQNDLINKTATSSKSFYSDSKTSSSNPQNQRPLNLLSMKSSSTLKLKKEILGLSPIDTIEPVTNAQRTTFLPSDDAKETRNYTPPLNVDIKSVASELKRKIKEDEKMVLEPKPVESETDEITLESLNVFKKKKTKQNNK